MIARELQEHFEQTAPWIDWSRGIDGFKIGDPDAEVTGIAVAWIAIDEALREAHELGCNVFVTHEDPFYAQVRPAPETYEPTLAARRFLEETGMLIYRCHDAWDTWPEIGVLDSWATVLGLEGEPANADTYYKVYDVGPTEAGDLGRRILERVKPLGQESVIFYGDETTVVSKLGIGTGAIANPFKMVELGADALLCTDDPLHTTSELGWCLDMGVPVFVVNHATAEVTGIAHLATYVAQQFSDVPVEHLPQGCMYSTIS